MKGKIMMKPVPLLPLSNVRLWRPSLITCAWSLLSMALLCLGAPLLVFLYRHGVIDPRHTLLGAGVILGIMLCVAFSACRKIYHQNKAMREQYWHQTEKQL
jgi:zinc transporter ZupT